MTEGKKCGTCKKIFTENLQDHFHANLYKKDRMSTVCKPCTESNRKKRIEKNRRANEYKQRH